MTTCCPFPLSCISDKLCESHHTFPLFMHSSTYPLSIFIEILPSDCIDPGFRHIVKMVGMICFENANSSWPEWGIREQCEYNTKFMFANKWFLPQETLEEHSQLHPAVGGCMKCTQTRSCLKRLPTPPLPFPPCCSFTMNHKQQYDMFGTCFHEQTSGFFIFLR